MWLFLGNCANDYICLAHFGMAGIILTLLIGWYFPLQWILFTFVSHQHKSPHRWSDLCAVNGSYSSLNFRNYALYSLLAGHTDSESSTLRALWATFGLKILLPSIVNSRHQPDLAECHKTKGGFIFHLQSVISPPSHLKKWTYLSFLWYFFDYWVLILEHFKSQR